MFSSRHVKQSHLTVALCCLVKLTCIAPVMIVTLQRPVESIVYCAPIIMM